MAIPSGLSAGRDAARCCVHRIPPSVRALASASVGCGHVVYSCMDDGKGLPCLRHWLMRSSQPRMGFDISSKGNDDLAELAAVLEIAVHFHHFVELECAIDDRLERATREALGDVRHCDLPAFRVARHQPNAVSLDRWHLP